MEGVRTKIGKCVSDTRDGKGFDVEGMLVGEVA